MNTLKLSKKDRVRLESIFSTLKRGSDYLFSEQVVVGRKKPQATTTLDFESKDGKCITLIEKELGTELVLIQSALASLQKALYAE